MVELFIHIESGEIVNRKGIRKAFGELADGKYLVKIDPFKKRSLPQNAYLHGVLIPAFRQGLNNVGYDEVDSDHKAKEVLKNIFLKTQIVNHETGEVLEYVRNTSDLTTTEMNDLFERVWKFCAENLGTVILSPGSQSAFSYGE